MDTQELSRWAIRFSVLCYVLNTTSRIRRKDRVPSRIELILWVAGCVAYLVHVGLAFHAFHDWSHQAAVQFTADETKRVIGIHNGQGVWANYAFAVVWIGDCVRLARIRRQERAVSQNGDAETLGKVIDWGFALMMFSATVVFGPPFYRVLFVPLLAVWIWFAIRRERAGHC